MRSCTKKEATFSETGFSYWNDGLRKFKKHETSLSHKEALSSFRFNADSTPINESLSKAVAVNKAANNSMLTHVVQSLKFLSRQNLPPRGKYVRATGDEASQHFSSEPNSNLNQVSKSNIPPVHLYTRCICHS